MLILTEGKWKTLIKRGKRNNKRPAFPPPAGTPKTTRKGEKQ